MSEINSTSTAGNIVRRVREDAGISRARLSQSTGVSSRALYALETGESENFGLGNFLKVLSALGLSMDIALKSDASPKAHGKRPMPAEPWDDLSDVWKIG